MQGIESYFHELERRLDCPGHIRKPFLNKTRQMAKDFVQGKPDATPQEIIDYLGEPQELAQGFLETLDLEMLERYHKRKKFLLWGCMVLLVVALVAISIFGIYFKKTPVIIEQTDTIVIYGDLTYKGTTEEVS